MGRPARSPTSAASTSALGSRSSGGSNHSSGLPIGVAIGALALAAVAAVLFERWRRSRRFAAASTTASPATALSDPAPPSSAVPVVASFAQDAEVLDPDVSSSAAPADDVWDPTTAVLGSDATRDHEPDIATGPVVVAPVAARAERSMAVDVLGWRHFVGVPAEGGSPSLEALLAYLAFHNAHHLSADQIALGMWPLGRQKGDVARKTIHNNLSALRAWIGVEHLPDAAAAGGYLVEGIGSDWSTFGRLNREADTVDAEAARKLRTEALELVRGRPFEGLKGVGYGWIDEEGLIETMTKAIVTCAVRLGSDLMEADEYAAAEDAAPGGCAAPPTTTCSGSSAPGPSGPERTTRPCAAGCTRRATTWSLLTSSASVRRSAIRTLRRHSAGRRCAEPPRRAGAPCARRRRGARGRSLPRAGLGPPCGSRPR